MTPASPGKVAPEAAVQNIAASLAKVQEHEENLELENTLRNQVFLLAQRIKQGKADLRANALHSSLTLIIGGLIANLQARLFLFVPTSKASFYNSASLFGDSPLIFPEAMNDMIDAGTSYAADLPTACIFHLMRVSEFGLRALAGRLRVSLRDNGKACRIEYATWNKVLDAIDSKIKAIRSLPSGAAKSSRLMFYSDAASHCRHIRDIWRNEVSHTRTRYNEYEAFAALNRIADLMQLLTEGLYSDKQKVTKFLKSLAKNSSNVARKEGQNG